MPEQIVKRGYSKKSFEEALENAIKELSIPQKPFHDYVIVKFGKEVGGLVNRNDYYVEITN